MTEEEIDHVERLAAAAHSAARAGRDRRAGDPYPAGAPADSLLLLLAVQLLVVAAVFRMEGEPFVFLHPDGGVRFVLRPDALGRLFAELICAVWFAVAFLPLST